MKSITLEQDGEIASKVLMTLLTLVLIAGYVCLFQLFRADRQEVRAAVMEQQAVEPHDTSLSYQEME